MAAERPPSIGFMGTFKSVFRLRKTSSRAASVSSAQDSSLSQDNGQVSKEQDDSLPRSIRSHPTSPPPTSTSMISTDADATDATRSLPEIVDAAPAQGHIPGSQPTSTTSPTSISDSGKLLSRFKRFAKTPQAVNVEARALQPLSGVALVAWHGFKQLSKNTEKFLEGTPFKVPIGVINTILSTADTVIQNRESVAIHFLPISERLNMVLDIMTHNQGRDSIAPTCERFSDILAKAVTVLEQMHAQGLFKRILEANEQPQQITNICVIVDEATKNFQLELTLANVRQTNKIKTDTEISRLANLRPSKEVTYVEVEREPCVKGTRKEVLESVLTWCKDPDSAPIYWLSGMAGTGKSTIAYTICEILHGGGNSDAARRLGASFFCSRQMEAGRTRKNIVPTIAHDLALSLPSFGRKLLDLQFDAQLPPLKDHLRRLLLDPWCESIGRGESIPPLVVVVDAVDELQDGEGSAFLGALIEEVRSRKGTLRGLKFLVTRRQDPRIVRVCDSIGPGTVFRLEDVPSAIVERDIVLYLRAKLPSLTEFVHRELAGQAATLFIYAATVVRFIVPPGDSEPNLKHVKLLLKTWPDQTQRDAQGLLIDRLYADILSEQISPKSQVDKALAIAILQTTVCSARHTLLSDIPLLMHGQVVEEQDVKDVIFSLHAVMYVSDGRVCFHHKSFLDFMLDSTRFGRHELAGETCSMPEREIHIASSCFHLMRSLRFNICDLPSSYLDDSQVPDLQKRKDDNISSALQYTCRFWAAHLTLAHVDADDRETREKIKILYWEWLEDRSVFWIEAMSLLGYMGECYFSLTLTRKFLREIFSSEEMKDHLALEKLVITFGSNATAKSTPHLYLSALAASSPSTRIISRWLAKFPWIPRVTALHVEGPLTVLPHGDDSVLSVAFSPDGTRLVSCLVSSTLCIWDVSTGIQLHRLVIDEYRPLELNSACFSSGGRYVIFGSGSSVEVWDTWTWSFAYFLDGHQDVVLSISVSSKHIVSGSRDRTVRIWDIATKTPLHVLHGHKYSVQSVCFSLDGCHVASGSLDNTVRIWDVLTGNQLCQLDGHKTWVSSVCFSPDGRRLVSGSYDHTVRIWDMLTGSQLYKLIGHQKCVLSVSFSPDGTHIASGSSDRSIRLWDASDGKELHQLDGHNDPVDSVSFSSDSTRLASGSTDGTVRIWDASRASHMTQLNGHKKTILSLCSSPSRTYVVSGSEDRSVCVWDLPTGIQLHRFDGHNGAVLSVSCSPDGRYIASGSADNSVRIWDLTTGIQLRQLTGHYDSFCAVCFSPDGAQILSGSRNATVCIWDTLTGHQLHKFTIDIGSFHTSKSLPSICFSPDGRSVVSGSNNWSQISVWDVSTGNELRNIRMEPMNSFGNWVPSVCFSPDATNIASWLNKTVRIWNLSNGEHLRWLDGHSGAVNSVCFSPDGSLIASGSADKTLCIWNASTGRQLHQLSRHNSSVLSVCFSSDGAQVISASNDNIIRVWDLASLSQFNGERCAVPFTTVSVNIPLASSRGMDTLPLRAALWKFRESGSMRADWVISPDGWIASSTGERYMWLSDDMHSYLQRPDSFAISLRGSVEVDFTTGYFGTAWKECYELSAMERLSKDKLTECDEYTEDFEACGNSEGHDSDASESEC